MIDVLHIPGSDRQLQSVSRLAERGMSVEFQKKSCTIWNKSKAIASGKKIGKAYVLDCEKCGEVGDNFLPPRCIVLACYPL
ncbi:hypothetical protein PF007_g32232 [Phytophthora fragariae]|nr:hypothetical protein PF007_g32232 [Phytophthora fragariae]